MTSTLTKPDDFEADFVTKEYASRRANELHEKWAKDNNICLHPKENIRASKLNWDLEKCIWKCGVCEKEIDVIRLIP